MKYKRLKATILFRYYVIALTSLLLGLVAAIPANIAVYAANNKGDLPDQIIIMDDQPQSYPIMYLTAEQAQAEDAEAAKLPRSYIDLNIQDNLAANSDGTSLSLLSLLQYTPSERNQLYCGDCWAWAGTGCLEAALNVQRGIKDRLSVQYINSNYNSGTGSSFACCGGSAAGFANYYNVTLKKALPWSNTNAGFADASQQCGESTAMPAASITTTPNYPMSTCSAYQITTQGVSQATAIANIKNVLSQNKAIYLSFRQANTADWDSFRAFWNNQTETALWTGGYSCGETWGSGAGGHAVLCVGYDDSGANPYWLILNSWGTKANRPNGLFRIPMNYDYNCYITSGGYATNWFTIEPTYILTPTITNSTGATSITATTATLNGNLTSNGGADTTVHIYWADNDAATGTWDNDVNLGVRPAGAFNTGLAGLTAGINYYYRCSGINSAGTSWASPSVSFITTVLSPTITGASGATNITSTTATLNGSITSDGGQPCQYRFCRGMSPGIYSDNTTWSTDNKTTGQSFSANVTGMSANTTYYYVAECKNSAGTGSSTSRSFTTLLSAPTVANATGATGVTATTATLNGSITTDGGAGCQYRFCRGTSPGIYTDNTTWSTENKTTGQSFSANVTGLGANTRYNYVAECKNAGGTGTSSEKLFDTPPYAPSISHSGVTAITTTSATLNGNLDSNGGAATVVVIHSGTTDGGTTIANWGRSDNLGVRDPGPFYLDVRGLTPSKTYYYRYAATNSGGKAWAASSSSFTTQSTWAAYWEGPGKDWWRFSSGILR